ncbi:MAG: hypothetical protein Q9174_000228 [Haloplaca sp. 1 TL-2023]
MSPGAIETASVSASNTGMESSRDLVHGQPPQGTSTVQTQKTPASPSPANIARDPANNQPNAKNEKLTGAELKKRKQAEKAAKRAQAKEQQPSKPVGSSTSSRLDSNEDHAQTRNSTAVPVQPSATKVQHKGTSSAPVNTSKALQLRPSTQSAQASVAEPKPERRKAAFCNHLYGVPRRTTIAGASKDVHPAILVLGLQMSNYVICGSNARCVSTLLVFKKVINAYSTPPGTSLPRHLTLHLSTQIDYLVSCRPLSMSMGNAIRWLKLTISTIDPDTPESKAKQGLCSAIDNFIRERVTVAGQAIASSACSKIQDGDVIMTFAKSSIVQRALVEAYRLGKSFRVIVVDSRPLTEGRNLAIALSNLGLEVEYARTETLCQVVQDATKVFLGAHAMMSNGRLYSRIGTAMVAMMAKESNVPTIVLCESIKFTERVALDSIAFNEVAPPGELGIGLEGSEDATESIADVPNLQILNLMYDLTPADSITMIITEYGSLPPSSVPVVQRLSTNT